MLRMNVDPASASTEPGLLRRALLTYRAEMGHGLGLWALIAVLSFATQIIFRREMQPGEFGTLNTALGMMGLMTLPVLAVNQAFRHYLACPHPTDQEKRAHPLRDPA